MKPPAMAQAQQELNEAILVACMIETPEAVENAEGIAAVPGVDVLLIGTSDLTASMGIPGQQGHPDVVAAYAKVAAACAKAGKVMGMGGVYDEVNAAKYIGMGARFLLSGSDHNLLLAGATARSSFLRALPKG
jgi:2-keto-3-deoxy-L-rhamnonate aldolase RhmA